MDLRRWIVKPTTPYVVHRSALIRFMRVRGRRMDAELRVRMTSAIVDSGAP